jgi:hypothetical protein
MEACLIKPDIYTLKETAIQANFAASIEPVETMQTYYLRLSGGN